VKSGKPEEVFLFETKEGSELKMICPRCGEATASKSLEMEMSPSFRMEKIAGLKCSRCGLDESTKL
jgi:ribosomal protein S27AE